MPFIKCNIQISPEYTATSTNVSINGSAGQQDEEIEEYQPISAKEEDDFRTLLNKCHMTIGQAERFADHLTRELSVLDSVKCNLSIFPIEQKNCYVRMFFRQIFKP